MLIIKINIKLLCPITICKYCTKTLSSVEYKIMLYKNFNECYNNINLHILYSIVNFV